MSFWVHLSVVFVGSAAQVLYTCVALLTIKQTYTQKCLNV